MRSVEADLSLDTDALAAIERRLHGKLRAYRFPKEFIDRHGEDALGQGLAELSRARARGTEIENPGGWVLEASFRRAIDTLRHELREAPPAGLFPPAPLPSDPSFPTEEEAILHIEAERLPAAIRTLSPQQRQALGLYYFEELPTRECARALGCSEPTFRRRRDAALRVLRQRFGIPTPEPGDQLAIEVGLAAWLSLGGARVVPTGGIFERLIGAADQLRAAAEGIGERGRELATRLLASGGTEGIGAVASGPAGKAAGACAAALAACALTGVIGPGVGGVDLIGGSHARPQAPRRVAAKPAPIPAVPPATAPAPKPPAANVPNPPHRSSRFSGSAAKRTRRATRTASTEFGFEAGTGSHEGTSTSSEPAPAPAPGTYSPKSSSSSNSTRTLNEEFGVEGR